MGVESDRGEFLRLLSEMDAATVESVYVRAVRIMEESRMLVAEARSKTTKNSN